MLYARVTLMSSEPLCVAGREGRGTCVPPGIFPWFDLSNRIARSAV